MSGAPKDADRAAICSLAALARARSREELDVAGAQAQEALAGAGEEAHVLVADGIEGARARITAEERRRETEDRLQSLIQGTTDAVWCYESREGIPVDLELEAQLEHIGDMILVEGNRAYARARGVESPDAMLGRRMRDVAITPLSAIRHVYTLLAKNGFKRIEAEVEKPVAGGVQNLVIESFAVLREGRLFRLWGSIRDVTERRRNEAQQAALERQLQHAQKLESVGLLAGGIAHDFNNLLTVIGSAARFAEADLERNPAGARESLSLINQATTRAADLTRRLLAFSRHEPTRREVVNPNDLAREIMRLLRRLLRETVALELECGESLRLIDADSTQFEQALVNLCVNASDAIPGVGRVVIRTANADVDNALARRHPGARAGKYVRLSVMDSGCGIPADVRDRIFEPFFTTKPNAAGTGLGLSVVYGVVRQHGGFIEVESEVGAGSTFHLYFPASQARALTPQPSRLIPVSGGTETILVVEDEALVREIVERMLEKAGYKLLLASDGEEAVRLFDEHADAIDLVLLDAVLPAMSGREVFDQLVARCADVTVLFASGYTGGALPDEFLAERGLSLVPKPYQPDDLLRAVRDAIDGRARR